MRNLILCGFMGCGKTTVGRRLARLTGRRFVDMDAFIEGRDAGEEIFDRYGEADFRRREREACAALAAAEGLVIAAGGGTLTFPENAAALAATGVIVLLEVSPETVLRRLEGDDSRPLLRRPDKAEAVRELMERREPLYRAAASVTVSGEADPDAVAAKIHEICG